MWKEKIKKLLAEIEPKRARMNALLKDAMDDGEREFTDDENEEFEGLATEVADLEKTLGRMQKADGSATTARPISGNSVDEGSRSRERRDTVPAEAKRTEEKGIGFARAVMLVTHARLKQLNPIELAKSRFPNMGRDAMGQLEATIKAQTAGATSTDSVWAGPLVQPTNLASEFVEFLRPRTIIGRFGTGTIPGLRPIPFNVQFPAQIQGGDGYWVGEGKPKPVTRFGFENVILRFTKAANIAVVSEELLRFSSPSAELVVRNALADALQARLDSDFINPSITLIADVRPASVTNGATNSAASGIDADAVRADIRTLITPFITANIGAGGIVLVMREAQALSLSLMRNSLGQREFPDITLTGGFLEGMPVITSQHVPQGIVAAVAAPEIYLADDGDISVDLSREASLEMATDPTNDINDGASPAVSVESAMVSMFQTNSVAIRAERMINFRRRRSAAVSYLTSVGWGNQDTSPPQAAI